MAGLGWAEPLAEHGIEVDFLCPEDIGRFRANKIGS